MTARLAARVLLLSLLLAGSASAVQPDEMLADPALEARARVISRDLRCLVCQNQSIDDSDAPLARDIRILIRQRIAQGESNETAACQTVDAAVVGGACAAAAGGGGGGAGGVAAAQPVVDAADRRRARPARSVAEG